MLGQCQEDFFKKIIIIIDSGTLMIIKKEDLNQNIKGVNGTIFCDKNHTILFQYHSLFSDNGT